MVIIYHVLELEINIQEEKSFVMIHDGKRVAEECWLLIVLE